MSKKTAINKKVLIHTEYLIPANMAHFQIDNIYFSLCLKPM